MLRSRLTFYSFYNIDTMNEVFHLINSMSPYLLLGFFLAGLMHAFLPRHFLARHLSRPDLRSVVKSTLWGIPLPLCSCGVLPAALSLRKEGASKGAVVSFLIATPQIGIDSAIATFSLMGLPFALVRPLAALVTSMVGGAAVNAFAPDAAGHEPTSREDAEEERSSFAGRMKKALRYAFVEMIQDMGKWLVIGLVAAGLITAFVPEEAFAVFRHNSLASMALVLVIAVPMYLCATGSIPIALALMLKGLTPGAALVLLMAGPACNVASLLVVRKALGTRTLIIYLAAIILGSAAFGLLIDCCQFNGLIDMLSHPTLNASCACQDDSLLQWTSSALLTLLLLYAALRSLRHPDRGSSCCCHTEAKPSSPCCCHEESSSERETPAPKPSEAPEHKCCCHCCDDD